MSGACAFNHYFVITSQVSPFDNIYIMEDSLEEIEEEEHDSMSEGVNNFEMTLSSYTEYLKSAHEELDNKRNEIVNEDCITKRIWKVEEYFGLLQHLESSKNVMFRELVEKWYAIQSVTSYKLLTQWSVVLYESDFEWNEKEKQRIPSFVLHDFIYEKLCAFNASDEHNP